MLQCCPAATIAADAKSQAPAAAQQQIGTPQERIDCGSNNGLHSLPQTARIATHTAASRTRRAAASLSTGGYGSYKLRLPHMRNEATELEKLQKCLQFVFVCFDSQSHHCRTTATPSSDFPRPPCSPTAAAAAPRQPLVRCNAPSLTTVHSRTSDSAPTPPERRS
jgi:hypothetical protein